MTPVGSPPVPFLDLPAQFRTIEADVRAAIDRVLTEQQFILGDEVAEFECDLAEFCDARDAIGCASGTDALLLSLLVLDVGPGDEVITSPFSFVATAGAIRRVGARPVFADIDPASFNLDPAAVEAAVTGRTRAILPVHLFGQCAEMEPLWRLAARRGLAIVEDACQAIGAEYRGRRSGVLGTLGCFSFFPTKNLGAAGDGGAITTDDAEFAARLRQLRTHGDEGGYRHVEVGLNSRLDAIQAAVLRAKLPQLEAWTAARRQHARRYSELFRQFDLLDAIAVPATLPDRRHVFHQFCVRVKGGRRDEVFEGLRERGIGCAVYYPAGLHRQECFRDLGYRDGAFPEAEAAARDVLALPIFPELSDAQQERVAEGLVEVLGRAAVRPTQRASFETSARRAA